MRSKGRWRRHDGFSGHRTYLDEFVSTLFAAPFPRLAYLDAVSNGTGRLLRGECVRVPLHYNLGDFREDGAPWFSDPGPLDAQL